MLVTIVVSSVPSYFPARVRALGSSTDEFTVLNGRSCDEFYDRIKSEGLAGISIVSLRKGTALSIYEDTIRELARSRPDVIAVAGWATPECFAAIAWARQNGRRLVVMSDSQAIDAPRSGIRELIKSRVVRTCDAALVAGRRHRDYIVSLGMPENRVFLGYDVVDNAFFEQGADAARMEVAATRAKHGLPERYLLASGRFVSKKNLPRLVEAYEKAIAGLPDPPDLIILGDGPERVAVEAAIARFGVAGRVHLPGFRGYDLLPAFYGLAEGFVHVSTSEQWGLVINEAAAAGLPLVVSQPCGAAPELLREGENGFLVNPTDAGNIARALRRLIELPTDARLGLGAASRRIVADWGPERFAEGLRSACQAALMQPARRLAPWDSALIRVLARCEFKDVA